MSDQSQEIIRVTEQLLQSIAEANWESYERLCDPSLTAFEPEGRGHLIVGLPFHKYYFELGPAKKPPQNLVSQPHVRIVGDVGIISYTRLTQVLNEHGAPITRVAEETRIWQKINDKWRHIHFHRSLPA